MKYVSTLFLFVSLLISSSTYAGWSHGGDIKWEPLGNDSFKIVVTVYRDCNGISPSGVSLRINSGSYSQLIEKKTAYSRDITPVCESVSSRCDSRSSWFKLGIQEHKFTYLVSLASWKKKSLCTVSMSWGSSNRTSAITTGGWNNGFYIHGEMNICGSPVRVNWLREPQTTVCLGRDVSLKSFCISTDSSSIDSVVYSWAEPLQSSTRKTTWVSPYSYDKPIYFLGFPRESRKFPQGLHLDSNSGKLLLRPMKEETTILKVKASIYRRGVWQGSVYRDQIFMVVKCWDNDYPKLSSIDCKSSLTLPVKSSDVQKVVCAGDSISFNICTSDKNKKDSVTLSYEHNIPGLLVTIDKSTATREKAVVSWQTNASHIREEPYRLIVRANDNACPLVGEDFQVYELYVKPAAQFKIDVEDDGCGNYRYTAVELDSNILLGTSWQTGNRGLSHSSGVFSDTAFYRHTKPGYSNFQFKASIDGFCPFVYNDSILVKDNFLRVNIGLDSIKACEEESITLNPKTFNHQGTVAFQWKDANDSLLSSSSTPSILMRDSSIQVFVKAYDGTCSAYDEVKLSPYSNPEIVLNKMVYACSGDSANVSFTETRHLRNDSISSIKWTEPTQSTVLSDSALLNTRKAGKYSLKITTENGCEILDTVTVSFYDPTFNLTGDSAACVDDDLTFMASSGQFGYYKWFVGGDKLSAARLVKSGSNISFKGYTSERVRLRFTSTEHGLSCPKVRSMELQIHPKPVFKVVHPSSLCQGDSVELNSVDSAVWRPYMQTLVGKRIWYKANDIRAHDKPFTTHLSATTMHGCSKDSSFEIVHNRRPDPKFSIPDSIYKKQEFLADNIGSFSYDNSYVWRIGNPVFATFSGYDPKIQIDSVGTFLVVMEAIDTITGCLATDSSFIKVLHPKSIAPTPWRTSVNVFPNPAHQSFHIKWHDSQLLTWTLSTLQGQEVRNGQVMESNALVNTDELPNGIYLLRASNGRFSQSILVEVHHP